MLKQFSEKIVFFICVDVKFGEIDFLFPTDRLRFYLFHGQITVSLDGHFYLFFVQLKFSPDDAIRQFFGKICLLIFWKVGIKPTRLRFQLYFCMSSAKNLSGQIFWENMSGQIFLISLHFNYMTEPNLRLDKFWCFLMILFLFLVFEWKILSVKTKFFAEKVMPLSPVEAECFSETHNFCLNRRFTLLK